MSSSLSSSWSSAPWQSSATVSATVIRASYKGGGRSLRKLGIGGARNDERRRTYAIYRAMGPMMFS